MSKAGQSQEYVAYRIFNGLAPAELPKVVSIELDFTVQSSYYLDFMLTQSLARMEFIQAIYVDATSLKQSISLKADISNQTITIASGYQAYLPFLVPNPGGITVTCTDDTGACRVQFINVPMPAIVWQS